MQGNVEVWNIYAMRDGSFMTVGMVGTYIRVALKTVNLAVAFLNISFLNVVNALVANNVGLKVIHIGCSRSNALMRTGSC